MWCPCTLQPRNRRSINAHKTSHYQRCNRSGSGLGEGLKAKAMGPWVKRPRRNFAFHSLLQVALDLPRTHVTQAPKNGTAEGFHMFPPGHPTSFNCCLAAGMPVASSMPQPMPQPSWDCLERECHLFSEDMQWIWKTYTMPLESLVAR